MKYKVMNRPTYDTRLEEKLLVAGYKWATVTGNTDNILVQFRWIFNNFGVGIDVLGKVVIDNIEIGEFSVTNKPTLQEILDDRTIVNTINLCDTEPTYTSPFEDVGGNNL
jgi:hypothetical protein